MTEQQAETTVRGLSVPAGYSYWPNYWTAQSMSWRTEPEIDEERQKYLAERRTIAPDSETGIYPFKDIKLDRADLEWLLATHESDGFRGPVDWSDEKQRGRDGLDVRGADLTGVDASRLPLARLIGALTVERAEIATRKQRRAAAALMKGMDLSEAHLETAQLRGVHLEDSDMRNTHMELAVLLAAHMEGCFLDGTHVEGADIRDAYFDKSTYLHDMTVSSAEYGAFRVANTIWGDVALDRSGWLRLGMLGDELVASERRSLAGQRKSRAIRLRQYEEAVRANRQIATVLRSQGLNESADRFAYRAQVLQRIVFRRQHRYLSAFGSWFLDATSGYGYRPLRSFATYVTVVLIFAATYFAFGNTNGQPLPWNEALVISMTAFHGRGFFSAVFQPGDVQAAVAAVEAFIGLLIEIVLIATFTQRFFAR